LPRREPVRAALFSLSNKNGADDLARALVARGAVIYATGGTKAFLEERGIAARDVGDLTGFPALFDGRVKTLHPKVFGAILHERGNPVHEEQVEAYAIPAIDTVVVNLYPFEATVARDGVTLDEAIEQIDIGGVALLRAAAKNFAHVAVLTHPNNTAPFSKRSKRAIFRSRCGGVWPWTHSNGRPATTSPSRITLRRPEKSADRAPGSAHAHAPARAAPAVRTNPQERAAFYLDRTDRLPEQLHGKALSYNNLLDLDATLRLLSRAPLGAEFGSERERYVRAAVVKHTVRAAWRNARAWERRKRRP